MVARNVVRGLCMRGRNVFRCLVWRSPPLDGELQHFAFIVQETFISPMGMPFIEQRRPGNDIRLTIGITVVSTNLQFFVEKGKLDFKLL